MSTNAIAWLLSFAFREGVSLEELSQALDSLRSTLLSRGRDTGFSGESSQVILHAVSSTSFKELRNSNLRKNIIRNQDTI